MTSSQNEDIELPEHTSNPVDVKLTEKQVSIIEDNGVLRLEHAICGESIRLWKESDGGNR